MPSTGLEDGRLLQARADLSEGGAPVGQGVRAWAATEVDADEALSLDLTLTPETVLPGEPFTVSLTLTNQDTVSSNSLALYLRIPGPVDDFAESAVGVDLAILSSESCDGLDGGGAICEPGEFVRWAATSLAPGQSTTVQVPMTLATDAAPGGLHAVWAYASDTGSDDDRVSVHRTVPEPGLVGALALGGLWLLRLGSGCSATFAARRRHAPRG